MGSVIGSAMSYSTYKKQKKELSRMEKNENAAEAENKKLNPAEARNPEVGDEVKLHKRRGIQSTFTATKKMQYED